MKEFPWRSLSFFFNIYFINATRILLISISVNWNNFFLSSPQLIIEGQTKIECPKTKMSAEINFIEDCQGMFCNF